MNDAVLIAAPTYSGLRDSLEEYLEAVDAQEWQNRHLMLVDNTRDGGKYADELRAAHPHLDVRHVEPSDDWEDTFHKCWQVIANHAEANGFDWVLSLEQDVILPAPHGLDTLLNVATYCKAPFVTHLYPYHNGKPGFYQGLGCVLMTTPLLCGALDEVYKLVPWVEAAIYHVAKRSSHVSLADLLDIKHRDGEERHWQFNSLANTEAAIRVD